MGDIFDGAWWTSLADDWGFAQTGEVGAASTAISDTASTVGTTVSSAASAVTSILPSKTEFFATGIGVIIILVLVLLILGKFEAI